LVNQLNLILETNFLVALDENWFKGLGTDRYNDGYSTEPNALILRKVDNRTKGIGSYQPKPIELFWEIPLRARRLVEMKLRAVIRNSNLALHHWKMTSNLSFAFSSAMTLLSSGVQTL